MDKSQLERYSRQILLDDVGVKGQLCIKQARVLIVGAGGLGCPVALYLAGAGVGKMKSFIILGRLGIVDHDRVSVSNLHRQIAHSQPGRLKVESLRDRLLELNPEVEVTAYPFILSRNNALSIFDAYDVVVDASDNAATRYLINDACMMRNKPLISGAVVGYHGQLTTHLPGDSACYRCLHPQPTDAQLVVNCDEGGVMGPVVGMIGNLQALECLRLITQGRPSKPCI